LGWAGIEAGRWPAGELGWYGIQPLAVGLNLLHRIPRKTISKEKTQFPIRFRTLPAVR
jgi:hypothetical protein